MTSGSGLDVPVMDACAFCSYLSGQRPFTVLWRSDATAILVTREQRGSTHLLVVPVAHRETILDLREPEMSRLMETLVIAARIIAAADGRPGIAVWQNNGIDVDQTIPHVHFHVASSLRDGGTERGEVEELSVEETDAIARRLGPHLGDMAPPSD
jgi:histidine triad (HIT) family protein